MTRAVSEQVLHSSSGELYRLSNFHRSTMHPGTQARRIAQVMLISASKLDLLRHVTPLQARWRTCVIFTAVLTSRDLSWSDLLSC